MVLGYCILYCSRSQQHWMNEHEQIGFLVPTSIPWNCRGALGRLWGACSGLLATDIQWMNSCTASTLASWPPIGTQKVYMSSFWLRCRRTDRRTYLTLWGGLYSITSLLGPCMLTLSTSLRTWTDWGLTSHTQWVVYCHLLFSWIHNNKLPLATEKKTCSQYQPVCWPALQLIF